MRGILILLLILSSYAINAQVTQLGGKKTTVENLGGFKSDSTLAVPRTYATTNYTNSDSIARLWLQPAPLSLYYHNGAKRVRIADSDYVATSIAAIPGTQHTFVFKAASINTALAGNTVIGTTSALYNRFVAISFTYVVTTTSGTVLVAPIMSIGFTPVGYTDIVNLITLSSSPVANKSSTSSTGGSITVPASTDIVARISTAATFTTTGTYVIDIYIQGYYELL